MEHSQESHEKKSSQQIETPKEQIKIPESKWEQWEKLLRQIPVSINNFYGDPVLQWDNTLKKLDDLLETQHEGPVGLITKGILTDNMCKQLENYTKQSLKIVVLISISELHEFEKVRMEHRYENIKRLNEHNVRNIAYVRPMTPPYNTTPETVERIFSKCSENGARVMVASGFRGDESIIHQMSPEETNEWVLRVKQMPGGLLKLFQQKAAEYDIKLFTRTSCAVSHLCELDASYNPYYASPNLVHCKELDCPIINTCNAPDKPREGSMELIRQLGYDATFLPGNTDCKCKTEGSNRLDCPSCCTTCYMLKLPRIEVKGDVTLGDLSFIRFITGILTMQPNKNDDGSKDIGKVTLPNYSMIKALQCLNSWLAIARIGERCFDCSYCIAKYYEKAGNPEFGLSPVRLLEIMKQHEQN